MNKAALTGRLTKDPEVRYSQGENSTAIARFTLAVDRRLKQEGQPSADFISCVAFGKAAEFVEKYFTKGMKMELTGRIQTGSYTNQQGAKVYTTDVIAEELGFAESKREDQPAPQSAPQSDGFMDLGDGIEETLPFN